MAKKDKKPPYEKCQGHFSTKDVYHYIDPESNINIKAKEVYKNGKKEIHYPFTKKDGSPKYGTLTTIIYKDMPRNLPRGFLKNYSTGLGFTKIYNPLIYNIQDKYPDVKSITVSSSQKSTVDGNKIILNWQELDKNYDKIDVLLKKHNSEKKVLAASILSKIFPGKFKKSQTRYIKNSLSTYLNNITCNTEEFSAKDIQSTVELFTAVAKEKETVETIKTLKTKEVIEEYYLEEVLGEFKKRLKQKTETSTLEENWQEFFEGYSWIFSQLFASPVLHFASKAYVGGKKVDNKNGKVTDFIYKNELTNNMALIEIKTHLTPLLQKSPYRGKDVFSIDKNLGGAIAQVLDQKYNLLKDFNTVFSDSEEKAFNPKCIVVIGQINLLKKEQKMSFELFRSNCKDVHIVTFDEVCRKIENLLYILSGKKKKKKKA